MRAIGRIVSAGVVAGLLLGTQPLSAQPLPVPAAPDGNRSVTLVTGDRVVVGHGRPLVRPAAGRERVPVSTFRFDGHQYVMPADAGRLVAAGQLDRRLFDVTGLIESGYGDTLPLIVTYTGGRTATPAGTAVGGGTVVRELPSVNGIAITSGKDTAGALWPALTAGALSAGAGVRKVWLDGRRRASLDRSVAQIGAPAAWAAGYTGAGVTVAVLDSGVEQSHPDLAGQEIAERNFSKAPDGVDRFGHGTHVASILAGTGSRSNGRYRGVAPGARLLDGKVLDDSGFGTDSEMIAGMQWAADMGARIVNLSVGGTDTPEIDLVEETVNTLSAQRGILFVTAAGNNFRPQTIDSPGSADAALTVGAVDRDGAMAGFSSRGPRLGDGAVKPDLTAPGVGIVAARHSAGTIGDPVEPGYTALSGTSMATPHVAGAAALLAQQHPDWTGAALKAALVASAQPNPGAGAFEQGAGRVDVARAITQTITTQPANLGLGVVAWPHDRPVTRPLTYRNTGPTALTLSLTIDARDPNGRPAPAGLFSLSTNQIVVPAGASAEVGVTADAAAGTVDGAYSGAIVATAGNVSARTPLAVTREPESHNLTLNVTGRDGRPTGQYFAKLAALDHTMFELPYDPDGSVTIRLPAGRYALDNAVDSVAPDGTARTDLLPYPALTLTADLTVDLDARTAEPIVIKPPEHTARLEMLDFGFEVRRPGGRPWYFATSYVGAGELAIAHTGPALPDQEMTAWLNSQWTATGGQEFYGLAWFRRGTAPTGFTRTVEREDLATLQAEFGAGTPGRQGMRLAYPSPVGGFDPVYRGEITFGTGLDVTLPGTRTEFYNTDGTAWTTELWQARPPGESGADLSLRSPSVAYRAGRTYREQFNHAVFGPAFPATTYDSPGVTRSGDWITVDIPLFGDASGNAGSSTVDSAVTRLFLDGKQLGEFPTAGGGFFEVPAQEASYRLTTEAARPAIFDVSTRVSAAWTFRSGHADGTGSVRLPLSAVRFTPKLDGANAAPAGRPYLIPTVLQQPDGSLARPHRLTVDVSYDEGRTWRPAQVIGNRAVLVHHPAAATSVSLRAMATDRDGNTVEHTIIRAYKLVMAR